MFEGVFLDLYGTITAGDRAAVHAACARLVADHSLPVSPGEFAVRWGERFFAMVDGANHEQFRTLRACEDASLAATVAQWGISLDPAPYVDMLESYWTAPPIHDDVRDALRRVPVPVCVVSNADTAGAMGALALHGLSFDHVVTSEEARCYKPHGAIFEFALRRTGWRRDRVIHVGDSLHSDIQGARDAGLRTGWMCREERIHDIGSAAADHTFANLHDLADMLVSALSREACLKPR